MSGWLKRLLKTPEKKRRKLVRHPELIFRVPLRYAPRYMTLTPYAMMNASQLATNTSARDWFQSRKLCGCYTVALFESMDQEPALIRSVLAVSNPHEVAIRKTVGLPVGERHRRVADAVESLTYPELNGKSILIEPDGADNDSWFECVQKLAYYERVDGIYIPGFKDMDWLARMLERHTRIRDRFVWHANNAFRNPMEVSRLRQYPWLRTISTDAAFSAAMWGRQFDSANGDDMNDYRAELMWTEKVRFDKEGLRIADHNHMAMLRWMNGYVGYLPSWSENVSGVTLS